MERVAVQVRLPAALAHVLAARINLAVLRRVLRTVVVYGEDLLPSDGNADALRAEAVENGGIA